MVDAINSNYVDLLYKAYTYIHMYACCAMEYLINVISSEHVYGQNFLQVPIRTSIHRLIL